MDPNQFLWLQTEVWDLAHKGAAIRDTGLLWAHTIALLLLIGVLLQAATLAVIIWRPGK